MTSVPSVRLPRETCRSETPVRRFCICFAVRTLHTNKVKGVGQECPTYTDRCPASRVYNAGTPTHQHCCIPLPRCRKLVTERRTLRCPRCGNSNPETNRFCGMCGGPLRSSPSVQPTPTQPMTPRPAAPPSPSTLKTIPPAESAAAIAKLIESKIAEARAAEIKAAEAKAAQANPAEASAADTTTAEVPIAEDTILETPAAPVPSAKPAAPNPVLVKPVEPLKPSPAVATSRANPLSISPPPEAPPPARYDPPASSVPSVLGLSSPGPGRPETPASQNLDYLLEDEQESRGGVWKYILMALALALAVGFGYLRWSGQGLSGLMSGVTSGLKSKAKPSASPSSSAPQASPDSAASPQPAPDAAAPSAADTSASGTPAAGSPAPGSAEAAPAAGTPAPTTATSQPAPVSDTASAPAAAASDAASNPPAAAAPDSAGASDQAAAPAPPPKPVRKPKPVAPPVDPVIAAEKFIYGRGAPQDCDRGLQMLRPSAAKGNPKAMISLGALYQTGVCAPRDLPTAYHWFALALRKTPDDQPLQDNMQKLWGQMTQPERQLAIRLSQ
jgi:hypothetical protein